MKSILVSTSINGTTSTLNLQTSFTYYLCVWFLIVPLVASSQNTNLKKVKSGRLKRLYQLNDSVYRSEQPNRKEFRALKEMGIVTSLTFRRNRNDERNARGTGIDLLHIPLRTAELDEGDIIQSLRAIQMAEKPILVHCWHGSDRTGAVMAAYRLVFENWSKEDAIYELRRPELGYHEKWYPNVIDLIKKLDVQKIRNELGLN